MYRCAGEASTATARGREVQDVVVFAPRRYGKSSLIWAATRSPAKDGVLVAQVDLMTTPTKERPAAGLAAAIYENIASPLERVWDKPRRRSGACACSRR